MYQAEKLHDRQANRDIRLDLLRSLAIVGVVTLHVFGGVKKINDLSLLNKLFIDFTLAIAFCSVNIFGLLSGYLKIDRKQHY